MNFTREPIIETIISPKDGYKLLIRNTKGGSSEYNVDAVEVVNFGNALFFRSLERPKAFLLPITDFEVVETKETRVAIKSAQIEKSVMISSNSKQEKKEEKKGEEPEKKKRRSRRRRTTDEKKTDQETAESKGGDNADEAPAASSLRTSSLFAPPASLISDKISGKQKDIESVKADLPKEEVIAENAAPGHQSEPAVESTPIEDDHILKPDTEMDTSCEIDPPPPLKIPDKDK